MLRQPILDGIRRYEPELVAIRQDIHRHPETRFEETRTAALVAEKLRDGASRWKKALARPVSSAR
jgi:metal-dependent amidase/aminoacylase/carboxypeptidase family protein